MIKLMISNRASQIQRCIFLIKALMMAIVLICLSILNASNAFAASPSGMVSDAFSGSSLNTSVWGFYDPKGDSSVSMTGSQAAIAVPGNSNHDLWTNALFAPRIRQEANDTDFVIETKIDSSLTANAQFHGFTVEQNALNFVDFIVVYNKSQTKIFSASFVSGVGTTRISSTITNSGAATYLRVTRQGNQFTFAYSSNGSTWTPAGTFAHTLTVARVGLVVGNAPNTSPAYTGRFDYFMVDNEAPSSPPPASGSSSGMVSDGFDGTALNSSVWGFYDPKADCSVLMTGTQAAISVPAGSNHDLWTNALYAPRIRQEANDTDFEIQTKIDSSLIANAQFHGFTVEQNALNFLDFIVVYNKSQTKIFSSTFASGVGTARISSVITNSAPIYLRIKRTGDQWTFSYSSNGSTWTTAGTYTYSLAVARVGLVGGNAPDNSPAYTARFAYFMVDGIAPGGSTDTVAPVISNIQAAPTTTTATITWNTNEPADSRVAYGPTSSYTNTAGSSTLATAHSVTLTNLAPNTSYHYQVRSADGSGNPASSLDQVLTTLDTASPGGMVNWLHLSSSTGDLPVPPANTGQVSLKVVDFNKDGLPDYMLSMWQGTTGLDTLVWYQQQPNGSFVKYLIDNQKTDISHSERFNDIDGDGDLDITIGQASRGTTIDWWENPYPNYSQNTPWGRRQVYSGTKNYHDATWGDFDGDGSAEYMSWNQKSRQLLFFEKPASPKTAGSWPVTQVFSWPWESGGAEHRYKGAEAIDINLDGKVDFVGGCGWFEHTGGTNFIRHNINDAAGYSQVAAAQLIPGGRPEVVCLQEEATAPLNMYQWNGSAWQARTLVANVPSSHSLQIGDVNLDGHLDIMYSEMVIYPDGSSNPNAGLYVLYGDGAGNFTRQTLVVGQEHMEAQLADIDNDGDLDIVTKPLKYQIPRVEMYINQLR